MTTSTITAPADYTEYGVRNITDLKRVVSILGNLKLTDGDNAPDVRADNNVRAAWGATALIAFVNRTFHGGADAEDWDTLIGDLLADLMHLCDALGVDWTEMVARGYHHYEPETHGEL